MKLIILDRDGVINKESRAYIKNPNEWIPISGSIEAIAKLTQAGFTINIATNQSGIARGLFSMQDFIAIHDKLMHIVEAAGGKINRIYFCPHEPTDNCNCRKPKPGMLVQMQKDLGVDFKAMHPIYVGDSLRDLELALATGCEFILVTGEFSDGKETLAELSAEQRAQIIIVDSLAEAATLILEAKIPGADHKLSLL